MKFSKSKVIIFVLSLLFVCFLSGCKDSPAVAIVYGHHSNSKEINLTQSDTIKEHLEDVAKHEGYAIFVTCEGYPVVYFQDTVSKIDPMKDKTNEIQFRLDALYSMLLDEEKAVATSEEVDTLEAISEAAEKLNDTSAENKVLVVADTGLATTGYLQLRLKDKDGKEQENRIDLSHKNWTDYSESIIENLKSACALPDLSGIQVEWMCLAEAGDPQERLNEEQKKNLENLWKTVLTASGAESVDFTGGSVSNSAYEDLPDVSLVETKPRTTKPIDEITLSEDETEENSVLFNGDSAEFVNPEKAKQTIQTQVGISLKENPENSVYIVGTTAGCKEKDKKKYTKLAIQRAEAVRDVLVEYGIDSSRLICKGYAADDVPVEGWYTFDIKDNGMQDQAISCGNRAVHIIDVNSPKADVLSDG